MTLPPLISPARPDRLLRSSAAFYWLGALVIAAWLLAIRQMSLDWSTNPQYEYGWVVPGLAVVLAVRAWQRRPAPAPAQGPLSSLWVGGLLVCAFLAVPVRIIAEANPDWRLLDGYFTAQAILVSAAVAVRLGGPAWLRLFAFPILFPLVAIPWPSALETELVQALQRIIAGLSVEAGGWLGWGARQSGNLIILPQGTVGISEACSGIRSLQSSLMLALFLGDYFRLTFTRRGLLLVVALLAAFLLNLVRAGFLMLLMVEQGPEALKFFHDPAGLTLALGTLALLWLAASALAPVGPIPSTPMHPPLAPSLGGRLRRSAQVLLLAWFTAEIVAPAWYGWAERNALRQPSWTLAWPLPRPGFRAEPIDDSVRSLLRFSEGKHGEWTEEGRWQVFFFTWRPGRASAGLAQSHHPDICLPAVGYILEEACGTETMRIGGLELPMQRYVFRNPETGGLLFAFQAVTDDRIRPHALRTTGLEPDFRERLAAAWAGRRNLGQRSLLLVEEGGANLEEADAAVQRLLRATFITIAPGH